MRSLAAGLRALAVASARTADLLLTSHAYGRSRTAVAVDRLLESEIRRLRA